MLPEVTVHQTRLLTPCQGRIYTLDWDQTNAAWEELGENSKHVTASQSYMLIGWCTRFGGSGRRIIAGAPSYDSKGSVVTFDFDGYQWVSFPNETVEIETWVNGNSKHRLGESISVDGESEMVAIGKDEHHFSNDITPISTYSAPFPDPSRPNSFSVPDINIYRRCNYIHSWFEWSGFYRYVKYLGIQHQSVYVD